MNRVLQCVIAVAVVSLASVATAAAQGVHIGLGGGLIAPLSDYKNVDKVGWHATVNATFAIPLSPVGIRVDGLYGQTSHKDFGGSPVDGKTKLIGGLANLVYKIPVPAPMFKPYLLAGGGVYNLKVTIPSASVDTSETKFTWDFGGGASFGAGPASFFVEIRYVSIQESGGSTKFVPITAGVTFGAGKK
ncbi:MAG TPA: outer membrane beta-barrel protein [Gemmatimonadales bacterium]|nr:outer membrane beta-barrel protein [Gemmatimonadales bacterium]